jgi:hypothetical protein
LVRAEHSARTPRKAIQPLKLVGVSACVQHL